MSLFSKIGMILFFFSLFIIGIILLIKRKKSESDFGGIALTIIGGFFTIILSLLLIHSPSQEEWEESVYILFQSNPQIFSSIDIEPEDKENWYFRKKMTERFNGDYFQISDRKEIQRILNAVRKCEKFSANHPRICWKLKLTLKNKIKPISFMVYHTESKKNGTYFYFEGFGSLKSDSLGYVIEDILKNKKPELIELKGLNYYIP